MYGSTDTSTQHYGSAEKKDCFPDSKIPGSPGLFHWENI
jgi:hypothetical protein